MVYFMKKILVILMTLCLMAGMLCVTAFAEEPASDVVIRVSAIKANGSNVDIKDGDYKNFAEGWEAAVDYACDEE